MVHLSKLRVCCRLRPHNDRENAETVCSLIENNKILLRDPRHKGVDKIFSFDRVYGAHDSNESIYSEEFGREKLAPLFEGQNFTVFAHGSTGSGKTFTMQGLTEDSAPSDSNRKGIVLQAIETLFSLREEQKEDYVFKFSLYEIYCEKVRDLLQDLPSPDEPPSTTRRYPMDDLPIQKDLSGFEIVADIKQETLTSTEHFEQLYERMNLRRTERTNVNDTSSRSHCCAQITVEKVGSETKEKLKRGSAMTFHEKPVVAQVGRLFLVDLAGCEDNRMTGNRGVRMTESAFINDTYLALVKVFGAIKRKQPLSAFCRDAKLTRLLRGALEEKDSPSLVFITISPSLSKFQATLNTFSYLHFQGEPQAPARAEAPATPLLRARPQSATPETRNSLSSPRKPPLNFDRNSTNRISRCSYRPQSVGRSSMIYPDGDASRFSKNWRHSYARPGLACDRPLSVMDQPCQRRSFSAGDELPQSIFSIADRVETVPAATSPHSLLSSTCSQEPSYGMQGNDPSMSPRGAAHDSPTPARKHGTVTATASTCSNTPGSVSTPGRAERRHPSKPLSLSAPSAPTVEEGEKDERFHRSTSSTAKAPSGFVPSTSVPEKQSLVKPRAKGLKKKVMRNPVVSKPDCSRFTEICEETVGVSPIIKESKLKRWPCEEKEKSSPFPSFSTRVNTRASTVPTSKIEGRGDPAVTDLVVDSPRETTEQLQVRKPKTPDVTETWHRLTRMGYETAKGRLASIEAHGNYDVALQILEGNVV